MATLLLTWDGSDKGYKPAAFAQHVAVTSAGGTAPDRWSIGRRTRPVTTEDRVFLLRQGTERGIVASGRVSSPAIVEETHWADFSKKSRYVAVEWDHVVSVGSRLPIEQLLSAIPKHKWNNIYESGRDLNPLDAYALSELWAAHVGVEPQHKGRWNIEVGQHLDRARRMELFGGGKQGGMEASAWTPNFFIYSDPEAGEEYGYGFDGWSSDKQVFYYTGEGPLGDQTWTPGNRGLLNHQKDGRSVRLLVADGYVSKNTRNHLYLGDFALDPKIPYTVEDSFDKAGEIRSVFVFRLRPRGDCLRRDADMSATAVHAAETTVAALVELESDKNYAFESPGAAPTTAKKREAQLVARYAAYLRSREHDVKRWRLTPSSELHSMLTDLYDVTAQELYEAKGSSSRTHVRLAIGQLLDYKRHISPAPNRVTVLLPGPPAVDLLNLLADLQIGCVWEEANDSFVRA